MTNPDNIVRVRARNGGRASVYEANGWAQAYSGGLLEGNGVIQNTSADMNVLVGGSSSKPDVVLAENPAGYKIALDLVGQQAVAITAPASNSRISAIVAYTDDLSLASTEDTVTGSPASCGLIVVNGTASASPSEPTDAQIRTAITSDGATGSQAAYCVIATIEVASSTTVITNSLITIKQAAIGSNKIDFTTLNGKRVTVETLWAGTPIKTGSISLSASAANYKFIIIQFRHEDQEETTCTVTLESPNNKNLILHTDYPVNTTFTLYGCRIYITGTTISYISGSAVAFSSGGQQGYGSSNEIKITKVVGVKLVDGN